MQQLTLNVMKTKYGKTKKLKPERSRYLNVLWYNINSIHTSQSVYYTNNSGTSSN